MISTNRLEITDKDIKLSKEDPRFFTIIYQRFVKEIYAYSYYLSSNKHEAEDLTSMVFLRAIEKVDKFNGDSSNIRAWLYTVARNIFIDERRKIGKKLFVSIEDQFDLSSTENLENEGEKNILISNVIDVVNELEPPIYSEILILRYKQELEIEEIAKILGRTEQNIRTILHRAIVKLKEQISKKEI